LVRDMSNIRLTPEEIEYFSKKVRLKVLHEDDDIVLMTDPNEEQLMQIIYDLLSEKPMNLREIHTILSGTASEDKIRRALSLLNEKGLIVLGPDGRYSAVPRI
jgi:predicted transcriptional regulator